MNRLVFCVNRKTVSVSKLPIYRSFSILPGPGEELEGQGIPSEKDMAGGRRRYEIDQISKGVKAFNRDPIVPARSEGTLENPIKVPSSANVRAVGFEDPNSHQLNWFNLTRGKIHYVPSIGLHFSLE